MVTGFCNTVFAIFAKKSIKFAMAMQITDREIAFFKYKLDSEHQIRCFERISVHVKIQSCRERAYKNCLELWINSKKRNMTL